MNIFYTIHLTSCVWRLLLVGLILTAGSASAQISGTVFRDFNANGIYEAIPTSATYSYGEPTVAGIVVTAYNAANTAVTSVTTSSAGTYTLTSGITNSTTYRVEFTGLTTGDFTGVVGTNNGSSVQFVTAATSTTAVNFGINYPADYCQSNPPIATACYVYGNQLTGNNNADPVFITFPFNAGSRSVLTNEGVTAASGEVGTAYPGAYDQPTAHTLATVANRIGTTFGIAYARATKTFYAAAYFKKHAGFGPGGPSAIYVINGTTGAVSTSFSVPNATINSHNTADYQLDNGNTGWDAVGKTSLGGMDLSDDEQTLYVMNLQNRNLYALNPTTGAVTANQPMTAVTGCPVGDVRPFAVEYRKGTLYVGIVCTAESTPTSTSALRGYVYTVNPATLALSASPVFQFPLTYPRGKAAGTGPAAWLPWRTAYTNISTSANTPATSNRIVYPMPMLTSLDFDYNNDLIIGLRDRLGDITGHNTPDNPNSTTLTTQGRIAGDVLRAGSTGVNSWTLESNGRVGGRGTARQNTNQGPGGAEFYQGDSYPLSSSVTGTGTYAITSVSPTYNYTLTTGASTVGVGQISNNANGIQGFGENHDEVSLGTVLQIPGQGELMSLVFDPVADNNSDGFYDGGVRRMSNVTGGWAQSYRVYTGESASVDDFGKAAGLSEPVAQCNPAPIEIGNRVWTDPDNDGIQDANETSYTAVAGLTVQLLQNGTVISTTTVSSTGTYLFSSASTTAIQPNTAYQIRLVLPDNTRAISTSVVGTSRTVDSDANSSGVISLTTGNYGENNHTYDIGVVVCTQPTGTISATAATCFNSVTQANGLIAVTGIANGVEANISQGTSFTGLGVDDPTNVVVSGAAVSFTGLTGGRTYTVRIFSGVSTCYQDFTIAVAQATCCGISLTNVVSGACNTTTNQFTTTGTVRLSNVPTNGTLYVSNGAYAQTFAVTTSTTAVSFTFVAESDGVTRTISTSLASCGTSSTTVASPAACFTACQASCNPIAVTRYGTTAAANAAFSYQALAAEARYGNGVNSGLYELDFNRVTPTSTTLVNGQYNWTAGAPNSFTFTYDPTITGNNRAVFTLSSAVNQPVSIQTNPQTPLTGTPLPLQFNAIQLSLQATSGVLTGSSTGQVSNLTLNGLPVGAQLSATSLTPLITGSDDIIVRTSQRNQAFVLTGTITFSWLVAPPTEDGLALNIRLGVVTDCAAIPVTTVNSATIACQATSTTLSATSSQTGLAYAWTGPNSFTANTQSVTVTSAGTYTVVTTNAQTGCSSTAISTVTQNPPVTATVSALPGNTICQGTSVTLTANASGGTGFTYIWSPAGTGTSQSVVVSPTVTTPYTVTVTNSAGCSAVATATVTVNPAVTATVASQTICNGTSTTLTANASGGTGFTYVWSPAGTGTSQSVVISPTVTTPYTVTVTNSNGCSVVATATVTVNPAVTAVITASPSNTICNGTSATLTATGGTTYRWSTGATTAAITVSPTSTTAFSVTVTNSAGCSAVATATITVNPAVTATVASQTICNGTSTTLTANASGGAGFTYAWSPAGTGSTQSVVVSPSVTTPYLVTVTNSTGCSAVATATVTVNPAVTATVANQTICSGSSTTLTASGGVAYRWSTGATTAAIIVSPTSTTVYSVTVTNSSNCSAIATATVTVNPAITATVASATLTCQAPAATLSVTSSQTGLVYQWSGPTGFTATTQSITVTRAGTYTVITTNAQTGCTSTTTATVAQVAGVEVALFTQSNCLNNGTDATTTDDYFTVTIQATNGTPGASGRYDVVLGADANGLGGTVLNPGGTSYGTSATVGSVGQPNARGFLANGSSIYALTIRDSNNTSANTGCRTARLTGQVSPCSSCLPPLCQPARIKKQ